VAKGHNTHNLGTKHPFYRQRKKIIKKLLAKRFSANDIVDALRKLKVKVNGSPYKGYFKTKLANVRRIIIQIEEEQKKWYERHPDVYQAELNTTKRSLDSLIMEAHKSGDLHLAYKIEALRAKVTRLISGVNITQNTLVNNITDKDKSPEDLQSEIDTGVNRIKRYSKITDNMKKKNRIKT